jgi:hypothetical protein
MQTIKNWEQSRYRNMRNKSDKNSFESRQKRAKQCVVMRANNLIVIGQKCIESLRRFLYIFVHVSRRFVRYTPNASNDKSLFAIHEKLAIWRLGASLYIISVFVTEEKEKKQLLILTKFANLSQFTLVISHTVLSFRDLWKYIHFLPCGINTIVQILFHEAFFFYFLTFSQISIITFVL